MDRNPSTVPVPKRGLEPPLPLREPGPEPGASAEWSHGNSIAFVMQVVLCNTITWRSRLAHVEVTWLLCGTACYQIVTKVSRSRSARAMHAHCEPDLIPDPLELPPPSTAFVSLKRPPRSRYRGPEIAGMA